MHVDVLVVGAGPAGASTALHLVRQDASWAQRVLLIDRARFPRDKICGGGVTPYGYRLLKRLGLDPPPFFPVREAALRYRRRAFSFSGDPVIRIVDRTAYDAWFLRKVADAGVEVRQGVELNHVEVNARGVTAHTSEGVLRARALVAADGSLSRVRRDLDWPSTLPMARTLDVITPVDPEADPHFRESRLTFEFSAATRHHLQGYAWSFPMLRDGQPAINRGVYDSRVWPGQPRARLKQVLAQTMGGADGLAGYELKSAPIRWWDGQARVSMPRVLLAGDAAGVDPLLGEGISFAIAYGEVAAACLADGFRRGDLDFADYHRSLLQNATLGQIPTRYSIARISYRFRSPVVLGAIWAGTGRLVSNLPLARRFWRMLARASRALRGVGA